MKIYNTKTLKKELFKPIKEGEVTMYVCGPTVYDNVHIGNVRPVVVFDTLRRTFEELGYHVKYVSNYTDVDDKIIKRSKELNISEKELTDKMIAAYNEIRHKLNAADLYKTPRVTETMDEIISFIDGLVAKKAAYQKDGDVYFRTSSVKDYGSLSNQNIDDLKVGARIEENDLKESPLDFALWKKTDEGIRWPSKYSTGRPGWHTECVVMINKELGPLIDIHGGGKDLKFPHHENERAQSIAFNGSKLANYWMHSGMIDINGVKMSKSLGNFITAKDILSKVDPMVLRWFLLSSHYRDDINVSDEIIESNKVELNKIISAYKLAMIKLKVNDVDEKEMDEKTYSRFMEAMEDDLNTPNAYAVIFEIVKNINQLVRTKEIDYIALAKQVNTLTRCMHVLGIVLPTIDLSNDDKQLYKEWLNAKATKDFKRADEIRLELTNKGIL